MILPTEYVQLKHEKTVTAIQRGEKPKAEEIDTAIADYESVAPYHFCHGNFNQDLSILYMARFASSEQKESMSKLDGILSLALEAVNNHLNCQPKDGNVWLSKAIILVYQEGFSGNALASYKQSAKVAPREAWLAEKRSLFTVNFFMVYDKKALEIAINDLNVLEQASSNRKRAILKKLGIESFDSIMELLTLKAKETQ